MSEKSTSSILVLDKCVRVLECFTPERPRLQLAELRQETSLPPTTLNRILRALEDMELLQRDNDLYRVGLRVLGWTASASAGSELIAVAGPVISNLRDLTGESSGIYVRRGTRRVAVAVELSKQSIIYRAEIGQVMPMHLGAAGKVLMAFDQTVLAAVLELESSVAANRSALIAQLQAVRELGFAFTQEEREPGLNSMAAPVFGADGRLVAALAIGAPAFRLGPKSVDTVGPLLVSSAAGLSRRLGHQVAKKDSAHQEALSGDAARDSA